MNTSIQKNLVSLRSKIEKMEEEEEDTQKLESLTKLQLERIDKKEKKERAKQARAAMKLTSNLLDVVGWNRLTDCDPKYKYTLTLRYEKKSGTGLPLFIKIKFGRKAITYFAEDQNLGKLLLRAKQQRIPTKDPYSREYIEWCLLETCRTIDEGLEFYKRNVLPLKQQQQPPQEEVILQ